LREANVAAWLRRAADGWNGFAREIGSVDRAARVPWASGAALVVIAALMSAPAAPGKFRAEYDPKRYPARAIRGARPRLPCGEYFQRRRVGRLSDLSPVPERAGLH
jgi:hypothetical protein